MQSIFHKLVNRKVGNTDIVDVDEIEPEEERYFLPSVNDNLDITEKYNQIMFFYEAGIRQITTKLEILNQEFQCCNDRNPIENIKSRIKSPESIKENGYRSLHLIVMADVYFSEQRRKVPAEIRLRTIAMEFWASIMIRNAVICKIGWISFMIR